MARTARARRRRGQGRSARAPQVAAGVSMRRSAIISAASSTAVGKRVPGKRRVNFLAGIKSMPFIFWRPHRSPVCPPAHTNIGDHPSSSIFVHFSKTVEKSDFCLLTDVCMSRGTNRAQENADPMNKARTARIYSGHNMKNILKMYQTASYSTLPGGGIK